VQITYPQEGATWKNSKAKHGTCARGQRWKAKQQQAQSWCTSLHLTLFFASRLFFPSAAARVLISSFSLSYMLQAHDSLFLSSLSLILCLSSSFFLIVQPARGPRGTRVTAEEAREEAPGLHRSGACMARPHRSRGGLLQCLLAQRTTPSAPTPCGGRRSHIATPAWQSGSRLARARSWRD
jgi:hypothetical protein